MEAGTIIHSRHDGTYILPGFGHVTPEYGPWEEVSAYLAEHPEALVPEPVPPPPSPEELNQQRKQQLLAQLDLLDRKSIRPIREKEQDRIDAIMLEIEAIREELATL